MALDPRYLVSIAFEQYIVDNTTGLPAGGGYIEFYIDDDRDTPKLVYELTGDPPNYTYTPLPNPLPLGSSGIPVNDSGTPINVYAYPYDAEGKTQNYYAKIYNANNELLKVWPAWPNVTDSDNPNTSVTGYENQLANPQFALVNFVPETGVIISFDAPLTKQSYDIAPGWELIISSDGAGSVQIDQVSIEGSLQIQTNPPYFISFLTSGANISQMILRQTLANNPDIWSTTLVENGYVGACMLVTSYDAQNHSIAMKYTQSSGPSSPQTLVTGSTGTDGYAFLNNTVLLEAGSNTDNSNDGAIYIDIYLPVIGYYGLTSCQVVGLGTENLIVGYQQTPVNKQKSELFYYYQPQLNYKPINSYLVGWDFSLNPAQPNTSTVAIGAVRSAYAWDQTIIFQSVNNAVSVSRYTLNTAKGGMSLSMTADSKVAIIQYLPASYIQDLLSNPLSSNLSLFCNQNDITGTVSLWYTTDTDLPDITNDGDSIVAALDDNGYPSSTNGLWTEIPRNFIGNAQFNLDKSDLDTLQTFGFNGWALTQDQLDEKENITYFAIVVGFSTVNNAKTIVAKDISLVPGYIPTISSPKTPTQVLIECQAFYEKSYMNDVLPGTATEDGVIFKNQWTYFDNRESPFDSYAYTTYFTLDFKSPKVSNPILEFYSYNVANSPDTVVYSFYDDGSVTHTAQLTFSSNYREFNINLKNASYTTNLGTLGPIFIITPSASKGGQSVIYIQYTADSRLGVYPVP